MPVLMARHLYTFGSLRNAAYGFHFTIKNRLCDALAYLRLERDRRRAPARNRLHALLRDWDLIGFYLPFGWPLLSLFRALRRPPCGYRGLSRDERRERQGNFLWRLSERPLPPTMR